MNSDFQPKNELEEKLLATHNGEVSLDQFMQILLDQNVFIPVRGDAKIEGFHDKSDKAVTLTVPAENGTEVLILFSSPERSRPFTDQFEGYNGGLLESIDWVLDRVGTGIGISINPDAEVGIDLEPDMVTQLSQLKAQRQLPDS